MESNRQLLVWGTGVVFGVAAVYLIQYRHHIRNLLKFRDVLASKKQPSKCVFLIRTDLGMGKGKVAAQVAHAAVKCYMAAQSCNPDALSQWALFGMPKITLKVDSEEDLLFYYNKAKQAGLIVGLIKDAGRTQIAPGSLTVLGIGPDKIETIDAICGQLKLY